VFLLVSILITKVLVMTSTFRNLAKILARIFIIHLELKLVSTKGEVPVIEGKAKCARSQNWSCSWCSSMFSQIV
jgi:hypothetical protein